MPTENLVFKTNEDQVRGEIKYLESLVQQVASLIEKELGPEAISTLDAKLDTFISEKKMELDNLESKRKEVKESAKITKTEVLEGLSQAWGSVQTFLGAAGISIPPVVRAAISSVFAGLSAMKALSTALKSTPFTIAIGIISAIATAVSIQQTMAAAIEAEQAAKTIEEAEELFTLGRSTNTVIYI